MSAALFVYGPLCHPALRAQVLGAVHGVTAVRLAGYRLGRLRGSDLPGIVPGRGVGSGAVSGLLIDGLGTDAVTRAEVFAGSLGYTAVSVEVSSNDAGAVAATAYVPSDPAPEVDGPWSFEDWRAQMAPIWVEAAREILADVGAVSVETLARRWPMTRMRAATRLRAATGSEAEIRSDLTTARDVEILKNRRPYTEFFSLEDPDLRFRRFDGTWSNPVRRAGFIGGDAATVLPYDPALDSVLLVEQFRTGPLMRGDPRPWTLEPIAGRIDPGEAPEAAARREAREEAGIELGALHRVADYYPTPGAVSEFLYSFVAEADLAGRGGILGGETGEDEDIRTHLVSVDRLMALIASGEAGTGPLILSGYWLALNRARLWG